MMSQLTFAAMVVAGVVAAAEAAVDAEEVADGQGCDGAGDPLVPVGDPAGSGAGEPDEAVGVAAAEVDGADPVGVGVDVDEPDDVLGSGAGEPDDAVGVDVDEPDDVLGSGAGEPDDAVGVGIDAADESVGPGAGDPSASGDPPESGCWYATGEAHEPSAASFTDEDGFLPPNTMRATTTPRAITTGMTIDTAPRVGRQLRPPRRRADRCPEYIHPPPLVRRDAPVMNRRPMRRTVTGEFKRFLLCPIYAPVISVCVKILVGLILVTQHNWALTVITS
jgi:hypothetical protein